MDKGRGVTLQNDVSLRSLIDSALEELRNEDKILILPDPKPTIQLPSGGSYHIKLPLREVIEEDKAEYRKVGYPKAALSYRVDVQGSLSEDNKTVQSKVVEAIIARQSEVLLAVGTHVMAAGCKKP